MQAPASMNFWHLRSNQHLHMQSRTNKAECHDLARAHLSVVHMWPKCVPCSRAERKIQSQLICGTGPISCQRRHPGPKFAKVLTLCAMVVDGIALCRVEAVQRRHISSHACCQILQGQQILSVTLWQTWLCKSMCMHTCSMLGKGIAAGSTLRDLRSMRTPQALPLRQSLACDCRAGRGM